MLELNNQKNKKQKWMMGVAYGHSCEMTVLIQTDDNDSVSLKSIQDGTLYMKKGGGEREEGLKQRKRLT